MRVNNKIMQRQNRAKKPRSLKPYSHLDATFRTRGVPIRVAHKKHTGRRLPFYCTSYAAIFFLIAFSGALILLFAHSVRADQQSGVVQLSGQVKGKPPDVVAKITYPANESHFTQSEIEIRGTCQEEMYVEVYRQGSFAGMAICTIEGRFKITITLVSGENKIKIRTRDSLGQYGPDSKVTTIYFDSKSAEQNVGVSGNSKDLFRPLMIYTSPTQRGVLAGQPMALDYEIDGDEPPYTIAIDWGDGSPTTLVRHEKKGDFATSHTYHDAGQRTIRISGLGSKESRASIQTVVVVHPLNAPISDTASCNNNGFGGSFSEYCLPGGNTLADVGNLVLPATVVATLMTASFWVGEKLTFRHMRPRH